MSRVKAALMGLQGVGLDYLTAIQSDDQFELLGVADQDAQMVVRYTEGTDLVGYTDYRSLIVEAPPDGLDVLLIALEPFQSHEFVELAARRGIRVFHKAPLARTVTEARHLIQSFDENDTGLVVARAWQSDTLKDALGQLSETIGRVFFASAWVCTKDDSQGWRGDAGRAGGGVLLNGAFDVLDLLVRLFGLPETVDAQCHAGVAPGATRNYDTEDAASVLLRFSEDRSATIGARRKASAGSWGVLLAGTEGDAELSPKGIHIARREGTLPQFQKIATHEALLDQVRAFARSAQSGKAARDLALAQHLSTIAVIEAAYLSAKTGEPEPPSRFLGLPGT